MTRDALQAEILRLPPDERMEFLGDAWDAIAASPDEVPVPEWHLDVLKKRLADPEPQTSSGLRIRSEIDHGSYPLGVPVTNEQMAKVHLEPHQVCG